MIQLQDIKRKTGPLPGGSVNLYLIPWKDVHSIPAVDANTRRIEGNIVCKAGKRFHKYEFAPGKCKLTCNTSGSDGSSYFQTTIEVSIAGDDAEMLSIFSKMLNGHFIALVDQASEAVKLAGSVDIPLICHQVDFNAGGDQGEFNGTVFRFKNRGYMVEDYAGEIPLEDAPAPLFISLVSKTDPDLGQNNGEIEVAATGGLAPYEFKIDDGEYQSSGVFENLAANTYIITVRDSNNNTANISVTLETQHSIELITEYRKPAFPKDTGTNGELSILVWEEQFYPPYEFKIDDGEWESANGGISKHIFSNLAYGEHVVSVKDGNGLESSTTFKVPTLARKGNNLVASNFATSGTFEGDVSSWNLIVEGGGQGELSSSPIAFEGTKAGKTSFNGVSSEISAHRVWRRNSLENYITAPFKPNTYYSFSIKIRYNSSEVVEELIGPEAPRFILSGIKSVHPQALDVENHLALKFEDIDKDEWYEYYHVFESNNSIASTQEIFFVLTAGGVADVPYDFAVTYDLLEIFEMELEE